MGSGRMIWLFATLFWGKRHMQGICKLSLTVAVCTILTWSAGRAAADDLYNKKPVKGDIVAMPSPAEVQALAVQPTTVTLKGEDDSAQLVVTGQIAGGRLQDLTGDIKYEVANPALARVTSAGRILPLSNGTTEITASYGDKSVKVTLKNKSMDVSLPINFGNQIVPL